MNYLVEQLNKNNKACDLLYRYNKRICCSLSDDDLIIWINKIITIGDPLGIIDDNEIVAFLLLYCNKLETLDAYICNVFVEPKYRGQKLSRILVEKAIEICKSRNFRVVYLDVAKDNLPAIKIYSLCGFTQTEYYFKESECYVKMAYYL